MNRGIYQILSRGIYQILSAEFVKFPRKTVGPNNHRHELSDSSPVRSL